jgi:hypothetical protein
VYYSCTHIDRPDSIFRHSPTLFTFGAKQITPSRLLCYILPHLYQSAWATIMIHDNTTKSSTYNCRSQVSWLPMERPTDLQETICSNIGSIHHLSSTAKLTSAPLQSSSPDYLARLRQIFFSSNRRTYTMTMMVCGGEVSRATHATA